MINALKGTRRAVSALFACIAVIVVTGTAMALTQTRLATTQTLLPLIGSPLHAECRAAKNLIRHHFSL